MDSQRKRGDKNRNDESGKVSFRYRDIGYESRKTESFKMEATSGVKDNMQQQVYDVEKDKTQEEQISCDCDDRLKDIQ